MKTTRSKVLLVLLLTAVLGYCWRSYGPGRDYLNRFLLPPPHEVPIARPFVQGYSNARPHADVVNDGPFAWRTTYPKPASAWQSNEKDFYTQLLLREKYDVLVVPFQVQDHALDQPTRSVLGAQLTALIRSGDHLRIPDPYLLARALGDGGRHVQPEQVYNLAQQLNVRRIVWSYVGHDMSQHLSVTLKTQDREPNGRLFEYTPSTIHSKERLTFSDENPPLAVAESTLAHLVREIGYTPTIQPPDSSTCNVDYASMPESPKAMLEKASTPAQLALAYEISSALTPVMEERARRRFAEKAWLAVSSMSESCPSYRLLKARALFQLGYRPAAIAVLATPTSAEEEGLLNVLNGNYPELVKLLPSVPSPQSALLLQLDLLYLGGKYDLINRQKAVELIKSFKLPGKFWPFFFERTFATHDSWMVQNNAPILALLAYDLPLGGLFANSIGTDPDKTLFEYNRKYWQENLPVASNMNSPKARMLDYLDLLNAIGTDNVFQQIEFTGGVQGLPEEAMRRLDDLASVYKDHPRFALDRSLYEAHLAGKTPGAAVAENLAKAAYSDAMNAFYWEQGQSPVASSAVELIASLQRNDYGNMKNIYVTDLPIRPTYFSYYAYFPSKSPDSRSFAAISNSSSDFNPVAGLLIWYSQYNKEKIPSILQLIEGRFHGCPDVASTMIRLGKDHSETGDAETLLRKAVHDNPNAWRFYDDLGTRLFEQGKTTQAFELFKSYPGFVKDIGDNPVGISNSIGDVAKRFYHAGLFEQAAALYKIADNLDTGADSNLVAHERLALMNGDLAVAEATMLDRVQRYGGLTANFEYQSMLHATGHSKEAWAMSQSLIDEGKNSSQWGGAITGFRIDGASETKILDWAKKLAAGNTKHQEVSSPGLFLMTAATFDRKPSQAVVDTLDQIEVAYSAAADRPHTGLRQLDIGHVQSLYRVGQVSCGQVMSDNFPPSAPKRKFIKGDRHYFVMGYRAMQARDYAGAKKILDEAGQLFDMTCPIVTYFEPYWAFAAAKVNDTAYIDNLLTLFNQDDRQFDFYLTKSVLQAFKHDVDGSISSAHMAKLFNTNSYATGFLPDYSYAEIMEWLYFETKNEQYRNEVLDWVAKVEIKFPWAGWAYAMQAELATDPAVQSNAAAMARYLDPLSERLTRLPKNVRDSAKFSNGNPFLKPVNRSEGSGSRT